jgi:hypothetical protein
MLQSNERWKNYHTPVVIDKLNIKDGDFVNFLIIRYGSIKIIQFKFNWINAKKQINSRKQKLQTS